MLQYLVIQKIVDSILKPTNKAGRIALLVASLLVWFTTLVAILYGLSDYVLAEVGVTSPVTSVDPPKGWVFVVIGTVMFLCLGHYTDKFYKDLIWKK